LPLVRRPPRRWRSVINALRILGFVTAIGTVAAPASAAPRSAPSPRTDTFDYSRAADVNEIELFVTNFGPFGFDIAAGNSGVIYPAGSGKTALFAGGLWIGAMVNGETRVTVAEYSQEYAPGPILPGGQPDDPNRPEHLVYKVVLFTGDPQDTAHVERPPGGPLRDVLEHHSWSEYMFGAAPHGAPWRIYRLPNTDTPDPTDSVDVPGPDVTGDQMLWAVFNDADPAAHSNNAGGTAPLGVEVRQSIYAFGNPKPPQSRFVFLRYEIENKGTNLLQNTYLGLWSDPDLGGATDDLVASKPACDLGFAYNATNDDLIYESSPPAVGFMLLETPVVAGNSLGMTAFTKYINGTDPASPSESYNYLRGLLPNGNPVIDPTTGLPTTFFVPGDPIMGTGWLDEIPADRRMMLSSGPFDLAPGQIQVLAVIFAIGQGQDRFTSIQNLLLHLNSQCELPPSVTNCPQPASFWKELCEDVPPQAILSPTAACVNDRSLYFDWPVDPAGNLAAFCAVLDAAANPEPRLRAEGEFAAFLANVCAEGAMANGSLPIRLLPGTSISCPGLAANSIGELAATAPDGARLLTVSYVNANFDHRRALAGVDWNGEQAWFFGGAGYAYDFLGSSIPPDETTSFSDVEIRFTAPGAGQKAYRYLRLEQLDGTAPLIGRAYLYGGYVEVPFQVWDVDRNIQIEAAFAERTVTDLAGTPLPAPQQPATNDGTWAPDASDLGGREYLILLRSAFTGAADPAFETDGALESSLLPGMYTLWSRLRGPFDVIDPDDLMRFDYGVPPSPGADALLISLAGQPQEDPDVLQAYAQLADCLAGINAGIGLQPNCNDPTPALPSVYEARVIDGVAHVRWFTSDGPGIEARAQRRTETTEWAEIARIVSDGSGFFTLEDPFPAGGRFGYRIRLQQETGEQFYGEVWLDAPSQPSIALGAIISPVRGDLLVPVTIGPGSTTLELLDVRGRRVAMQRIERGVPGSETVRLAPAGTAASGVYVLRLTQAGRSVRTKLVLVR
jgi:hypothetical protein